MKFSLPWRVMIPIILIIGLGMTLWGGIYLVKTENDRWHDNLVNYADKHSLAFKSNWVKLESGLRNFAQMTVAATAFDLDMFANNAALVLQNLPAVTGVYVAPENHVDSVMVYPNTGEKRAVYANFSRNLESAIATLPQGFAIGSVAVENPDEVGVFYRLPTAAKIVLLTVNIPQFLGQGTPQQKGVVETAGLAMKAVNHSSQQVFDGVIYDRPGVTESVLSFNHHKNYPWAGGNWQFTWYFDGASGGGVRWFAGLLISMIGVLVTGIFGWLVWSQQSVAGLVHQQVVERTNQLEQASRRFRLITDNAYDLISISSVQGLLEYVNSAYHRVLGYSRDEMQNQPIISYIHPKDQDAFKHAMSEVTEGKNAVELSFRIRHKNGSWLYMEAVAKGLHDTSWSVSNIVIHCRDVTARKQFADDLARSEQRFRDFAGSSADWLWEVNDNLCFTYVSPGVANVLGYGSEEMMGSMQFEALFERDSDSTRELIESRVQRRQPYRDIEFWTRAKNDELVCLRISGVPVFDEKQRFCGYRGAATNITASKIDRENMYRMATTDHLTGLLNRHRFMEELERSVSLARRHKTRGVLMFIDLDRFKEINDTHGHEAGDEILHNISQILQESVRSTDIVARLGGDEFGIIMHNIDVPLAKDKVQSVIDKVNLLQVDYNGARLNVTMSAGMVVYPQEEKGSDNLIMSADLAMYRAKDMGRNRLYVDAEDSSEETKDSVRAQLKWVDRLRTCLETGDFEMHYQAIVPAVKRKRPLFEALLRIYDENGNVGSPALYIDAAEHFGLIQQLDLSVIERCISTQADLKREGIDADFSINLSSRTLGDPEVMDGLREMLKTYDIDPARIVFEVTETVALHDPSAMRDLGEIHAFITELRRLGFRFALDDFGSGFSSFSYLRVLQVDIVKIDGSFVKDLETSNQDRLFVKSIADLASGLGIQVIAEFVENERILKILQDMGIDYAQGFHLARPQKDIRGLIKLFTSQTMQHFEKPNTVLMVEQESSSKPAKKAAAKPKVSAKAKRKPKATAVKTTKKVATKKPRAAARAKA